MRLESPYISLSNSVLLRKEHFGGIVFNTSTGSMMDVDRELYLLLSLIKIIGVIDINDLDRLWLNFYGKPIIRKSAIRIIEKMLALKMLSVMPQGVLNKKNYDIQSDDNSIKWPSSQDLSAPETVHWAVTFKCDSDCPDCYIRRHSYEFAAELTTKQAMGIIDRIAGAGVFQLAIGGGEPFLRDDLASIVARAHDRNLVVHITTGRYQHDSGVLRSISKHVKCMQIGIKHEELMEHPENGKEKLQKLLYLLQEQDIDAGANLILSRSTICEFDKIIELLATAGFKRITLLRYKPPGDISRWKKERPGEDIFLEFERKFLTTVDEYVQIQFRVDCGLAFLERRLPSQKAVYFGFKGCSAAARILSMAPDGSLFPCSQLVRKEFWADNLLEDDLKNIWFNSNILRRYRNFRHDKVFKNSQCGQCEAKTHCGGCRVFAEDALGADPGCPGPVLSPARRIKYCSEDQYNTILDNQELIGCTEGGLPYVTHEEIAGWLEEENSYGYPKWLIK